MSQDLTTAIPRMAHIGLVVGLFVLAETWPLFAATRIDELLVKAQAAVTNGNKAEAVTLATQAIEIDPKSAQAHYLRGRLFETQNEHAKAVADFSEVLTLDSGVVEVYQRRGSEHFKLGKINESIADFTKYLELNPKQKPYHWQIGIAYYYAGRYAEGKRQFELHQTVNRNDVENAVWHYLCASRLEGVETARASLIPIRNDTRIPMMTVYALFDGKATPDDVLKAAKTPAPFPTALQRQLFYANFYLGLYYEAARREDLARDYISRAVPQALAADYMGDVARVHAELLRQQASSRSTSSPGK